MARGLHKGKCSIKTYSQVVGERAMHAANFDLSTFGPFISSGTALIALILLLQACGIDLAKYVNSIAERFTEKAKPEREGNNGRVS